MDQTICSAQVLGRIETYQAEYDRNETINERFGWE